jgi:hypothetical protein
VSTKQIELLQEQLDRLVIDHVKEHMEMAVEWGEQGQKPNFELIHAFNAVLKYFMTEPEYLEYTKQLLDGRKSK